MRGMYRGAERQIVREEWERDLIPHFIFHEIEPLRKLLHARKDIVAIDVGANKGIWAKTLMQVYSVQHIYMIDASPENYAELTNKTDNLIFNDSDLSKLSAFHFALSDQKGLTTLYTNEDGSPLASLFEHKINGTDIFGKLDTALSVPMQTLDGFLADHSEIKHVDVLKLDVEGNELNILRGAENAIREKMFDIITFEFGVHQVDARHFFRDFYCLFNEAGFGLYQIHNGMLFPVDKYEYRFENFGVLYTFVAERRA